MNLSQERSCEGKVPYKTQKRADKAAAKLQDAGEDVHGYRCLHCPNYHVGHRPGAGRKPTNPTTPKAAPICWTCLGTCQKYPKRRGTPE